MQYFRIPMSGALAYERQEGFCQGKAQMFILIIFDSAGPVDCWLFFHVTAGFTHLL